MAAPLRIVVMVPADGETGRLLIRKSFFAFGAIEWQLLLKLYRWKGRSQGGCLDQTQSHHQTTDEVLQ